MAPLVEAYETLLIFFSSTLVLRLRDEPKIVLCVNGTYPLLDFCILNLFKTLSMYVLWLKPINHFDISLLIFILRMYAGQYFTPCKVGM